MNAWIIVAKMPSGSEYAFSHYEGTFALVPIDPETGGVRGASAWPSKAEAQKYLKKQLSAAPQLKKIGPFEFRQMQEPH